jgi:hypothetical protein
VDVALTPSVYNVGVQVGRMLLTAPEGAARSAMESGLLTARITTTPNRNHQNIEKHQDPQDDLLCLF